MVHIYSGQMLITFQYWTLFIFSICNANSVIQDISGLCQSAANKCDPVSSECTYIDGTISCECKAGFTKNGPNCTDVDECTTGKHKCTAPNSICLNAIGGYNCSCSLGYTGDGFNCTYLCESGYEYSSTSDYVCVDKDECEAGKGEICRNTGEVCRNFQGGYSCDCKRGFVEVHGSDGKVSCRIITPMIQKFGIPYTSQLNDSRTEEFKNLSAKLGRLILQTYEKSKAVASVEIKRFAQGSVVAWFEVGSSSASAVTPTQLRKMHGESVANRFWQRSLGNVSVGYPETAPLLCMASSIRSRHPAKKNWIWTFGETKEYSWKESDINCGKDYGYVAAVECTTRNNEDGTISAYYETVTLLETICFQSSADAFPSITVGNVTTETLELSMASINGLATNFTSDSMQEMVAVVEIMNELSADIDVNFVEVNEVTMTFLLWTADSLHAALKEALYLNKASLSDAEKTYLISTLDIFASHVRLSNPEMRLETDTSVFEAKPLDSESGASFSAAAATLDRSTLLKAPSIDVKADVPFSASFSDNSFGASPNALFYLHEDAILFPDPEESNVKVEKVLSVQISNTKLTNLNDPITQSFPLSPAPAQYSKIAGCDIRRVRCGYFNISEQKWKYNGCVTTVGNAESSTACSCNHATNFGVLVQTQHVKTSFALKIIGKFGCVFSIIGIVLFLIIHVSFRSLRTRKINQIHMHLCGCLLVTYITFLAAVERPQSYVPCIAAGAILHVALLAAWGWMVVEFVAMYKKFVRIFGELGERFLTKASIIVYSLSVVAAAVTFVIAYFLGDAAGHSGWLLSPTDDRLCWKSFYVSDRLCWLHSRSLYLGFLAPVGVIFCINFVGYGIVLRSIAKSRPTLGQTTKNDLKLKDHAQRIFTLSVLLGASWIFAVPLTLSEDKIVNEVFGWLFSMANAFQGGFIFLLFCVKRRDVRTLWVSAVMRWFKKGKIQKEANATKSTSETENTNNASTNAGSKRGNEYMETTVTALSQDSKIATIDTRTTRFD